MKEGKKVVTNTSLAEDEILVHAKVANEKLTETVSIDEQNVSGDVKPKQNNAAWYSKDIDSCKKDIADGWNKVLDTFK